MAPKSCGFEEANGGDEASFHSEGGSQCRRREKALEIGAGGIVVSNHGGAIIDYAAHPLEVLPGIKKVIGSKIPFLLTAAFEGVLM